VVINHCLMINGLVCCFLLDSKHRKLYCPIVLPSGILTGKCLLEYQVTNMHCIMLSPLSYLFNWWSNLLSWIWGFEGSRY